MSEEVTLEKYLFYLSCMKEVVQLFDEGIVPQIQEIINDADHRKKLPALLNDIHFLQERSSSLYRIVPLAVPNITGKSAAMGIAYVIEGSILGGRVILKHLAKKLGVSPLKGASFFNGYADQTGSMWKAFMDMLTHFAIAEQQKQEIIDGAVQGFNMIHDHFMENGNDNEN